MKKKLPTTSSHQELDQFLANAGALTTRADSSPRQQGRLLFAMDATASRQPSWDRACHLQAKMFEAVAQTGGLQVQLCYYRGYHEFYSSPWLNDSRSLQQQMSAVQCLGGYTQIARVLDHSISQQQQQAINGVVIIADAVEEKVDKLCAKAGQLGILGVPLFMFQEGNDPAVRQCFQQMANLSKGAYAQLDERSADQLAQMLAAVATYASGGIQALQRLDSRAAQQLLQQLKP